MGYPHPGYSIIIRIVGCVGGVAVDRMRDMAYCKTWRGMAHAGYGTYQTGGIWHISDSGIWHM